MHHKKNIVYLCQRKLVYGREYETYYDLVTRYGDIDLDQHSLRQWLVAWRLQVITWTNIDLASVRHSDIILGYFDTSQQLLV